MGSLIVYTGPMKCGKTRTLIEKYNELQKQGKRCVMIKPDIDTRFEEKYVVDRDGNKVSCDRIHKLYQLERYIYLSDYIFIDEFQLLSGDMNIIKESIDSKDKNFYVAGLNLTAEKEMFGLMGNLLCLADEIHLLKGKCEVCGEPSKYSFCNAKKDRLILIGDSEYKTVCAKCYNILSRKSV